jgi:DNA-binding MarR family transcriptional regulator
MVPLELRERKTQSEDADDTAQSCCLWLAVSLVLPFKRAQLLRGMPIEAGVTEVGSDGVGLERICGHLLRRGQQVHQAIWSDEFGAEITSPQYGVLAVLSRYPGISQRQLGEFACLDRSSTADVVRRLAERLWISQTQDPADARRNVLALAPAAAIAMAALTSSAQRVQDRLLEPLDADRVPDFLRRLRLIARQDLSESQPPATRLESSALPLDVPGHLIRRSQRVHQLFWFQEFGRALTGPQFAALYVLAGSPDINQRQLGTLAALDRSTGAGVISRLARRGCITRSPDRADGRVHMLRLSEQTSRELDSLIERVGRVQEQLLALLDRAERDRFLDDLAAVSRGRELAPI